MKAIRLFLKWGFRGVVLFFLFIVLFMIGSLAAAGVMPVNTLSEPGIVSDISGLMIIALANLAVITALILSSRWSGWKLALTLALVYYGAVTLVMQIETWYFLSEITVSPQLLPRLFLMGIPTAFGFIPLAVWLTGKGRASSINPAANPPTGLSISQWLSKLAAIGIVYLVLYWTAGYFIAWQNPELRAFYGQPGEALPFFAHTINTLRQDPWLFPFQILRAWVWVLCALPVIRASRVNPWLTALLVGLFFSVPQNIGHILANPLLPLASVRLSHLVETASSTFIFGAVVVWLFHRQHHSLADLLGIRIDRQTTEIHPAKNLTTHP